MWKRLGTLIDMGQNLEQNSIRDESELFEKVGMNQDDYLPAIHLYFRYYFQFNNLLVMIYLWHK